MRVVDWQAISLILGFALLVVGCRLFLAPSADTVATLDDLVTLKEREAKGYLNDANVAAAHEKMWREYAFEIEQAVDECGFRIETIHEKRKPTLRLVKKAKARK